jgi:hypothetical protein
MRCVRCEFENIPGETRCIRCGSILELDPGVVSIYPPRMPAWHKPLRDIRRRLRGWHLIPETTPGSRAHRVLGPMVSGGVVGLPLSIIPGFAHLLSGRVREVRLLVPLWLLVLGAGLFLYGSPIGFLLIGLAIGIHAWIAIQYGLFQEIGDVFARLGAALLVVVLLAVLYWATPRLVVPSLTSGYTALTIPALHIQSGDSFLLWRQDGADEPLPRGALVLVRTQNLQVGRQYRASSAMRPMIGQIAGLPGEMIFLRGQAYWIGNQRLDPNQFPVPNWLRRFTTRSGIPIPPDSYFVSSEYTIAGHANVGVTNQMIGGACLVKAADIRGRAFLHWWPLRERKFLDRPTE